MGATPPEVDMWGEAEYEVLKYNSKTGCDRSAVFHLCIIEKRRPANVTKGGEIGGEIEGRNWNKMLKKIVEKC